MCKLEDFLDEYDENAQKCDLNDICRLKNTWIHPRSSKASMFTIDFTKPLTWTWKKSTYYSLKPPKIQNLKTSQLSSHRIDPK